MGLFSYVMPVNIDFPDFDDAHNGLPFQTKCLFNDMEQHYVFNLRLYRSIDDHPEALDMNYHGDLPIYWCSGDEGGGDWVEYVLIFDRGRLVHVRRGAP